AERVFRKAPRLITVRADKHERTRQLAREHQRLVSGEIDADANAGLVGNDGDAVHDGAARIATREDRGPLALVEQQLREVGNEGSLAAAADAKIADADNRPRQPAPPGAIARKPMPPPGHGRAVDRAERMVQS